MEQLNEQTEIKKWSKGKRWLMEAEKCISKGSFFDETNVNCNKSAVIDYCGNFDLLKSFENESDNIEHKQRASEIRTKIYDYLTKALCLKEILLVTGFINYPVVYKQWTDIYVPKSDEIKEKKKSKRKYTDWKNKAAGDNSYED